MCVFLQGGNDGHGTVIATDSDSFSAFTQARSGAPGLAYPLAELLPIVPNTAQSGRTFALNPNLPGVQNLFNAGRAAIVANTGTLIAPATKAQVNANSVPLPASLFSHFDQTAAWQAIASNGGSAEHVGWGGSVADLIESMNMNSNSMFTCISTAGIALFLAGQTSFQLNVTSAGPSPSPDSPSPSSVTQPERPPSPRSSARTKPTSSPKNTKLSSIAPSRHRPCSLPLCFPQGPPAFPTRLSFSIP